MAYLEYGRQIPERDKGLDLFSKYDLGALKEQKAQLWTMEH